MKTNFRKYSTLITALVMTMLILGASYLSLFQIPNNIGYDFFTINSLGHKVSKKIIIVESDEKYELQGDETWLNLLKNLTALKPERIVFDFLPAHVSEEFYKLAENSRNVVFGRNVYFDKRPIMNDDADDQNNSSEKSIQNFLLEPLPIYAEGKAINLGVVPIPESQYGVFRTLSINVNINGIISPTFYYLTVQEMVENIQNLPTRDFRINFMGGLDRLPRLSVERILSGNMVSEMISGRIILIGRANQSISSSFFTPISTKFGPISNVVFEGFALDTLASNRVISALPSWIATLIIAANAIAGLFLFQWLSFQNALRLAVASSVVYLAACWIFLNYFFVIFPLCEFLLTIWLAFALSWQYKLAKEKQIIDRLQNRLTTKFLHKNQQASFYEIADHWSQVTSMIYQTLHLNRVIFLERIIGDHRLIEIKSLNCSIDDILEKRRDYNRHPYTLAISENRPILLKNPYLKETTIREREYLAPLMFAGEILGFWAFTIDPTQVNDDAQFKALTHDYMEQISEILFYRQEWQKRKITESNWLFRYLRFEGGIINFHALEGTVETLEKQLYDLQGVFNNMNTRSILYDLFGRVLLVNKRMEELTQSQDIKPYQMTLLDFMVEITKLDITHLKQLVQKTITELKTQTINFSGFGGQDNYQLLLHPLQLDTDELSELADETKVFQIKGVLLELVDLAEAKTRYSFKESIFEQFKDQLREKLQALSAGLTQISDQTSAATRPGLIDDMKFDAAYLLAKIDNIERYSKLIAEGVVNCYPQNLDSAIDKLLATCRNAVSEKKIQIRLPSSTSAMVLAELGGLDTVLDAAMGSMIEDTFESSEIRLTVEATGSEISIRLSNQGVGMLQDNLQQFWNAEAYSADDSIAKLSQAIKTVQGWKGRFELSSTVGEGSNIGITLQQFI